MLKGYSTQTIKPIIIPTVITRFLPMVSLNLPEKGLEIAALMVNSEIISPFSSAPPKWVIKLLSSGSKKLKLTMNRNIEAHNIQKFLVYVCLIEQR